MIRENVGIKEIGLYVPETIQDYRYIAKASNIPEDVILNKFGIKQRHKALGDENVSDLAIKAAKEALKDENPEEIDLIVYCGSEYKDYYLFNMAAKIQYEIGAINANAFEIHALCSAGVWSLKILKGMMLADESLKKVLLVSASKETDLVDFTNAKSRFMFNFGDGAAAVLLERNLGRNVILETHMITEGKFADSVAVYDVGSVKFNANEKEPIENYKLDVSDPETMKRELDPISLNNFTQAIKQSLKKSGYDEKDVDYVAPIFMKKSMLNMILDKFDLTDQQSFILEDYGHCQSADAFISLVEGVKLGRLNSGDVAVLLGAGTGYTWAATTVKWGEVE
jgi:3-oxoacyl-[acyl-carrier-protein] synthase-3